MKRFIFGFVLGLASSIALAEDTNIGAETTQRLNFLVEDDLTIIVASSENMDFLVAKETVLGRHIMQDLPLDEPARERIQNAFNTARTTGLTQTVNYDFDPFAMNPNMGVAYPTRAYFKAEITRLDDGGGSFAFFVKVTPLKTYNNFFPGGCEE